LQLDRSPAARFVVDSTHLPLNFGSLMRILALETSGRDATLAVIEGEANGAVRVVAEAAVVGPERSAQFLAPRTKELLAQVGWEPAAIALVAVTIGPGSFTGLRIGVTTAKTLAYAVGAEVMGVNTLAVIAEQAGDGGSPVWAVMDAQRQELFAAKSVGGRIIGDVEVLTSSKWFHELSAGDRVSGPVLQRLASSLPKGIDVADESRWQPMAATVGAIAWREYQQGRRDDLWKLQPKYYRQSAAEEKAGLR
jgi:tRNA threonylcarbamoyladenosine biosynthesis protein TsaB